MNDLDDQLNRTLREHADGVHGAPLAFDDVRGRATSIRRRRRLASGLGVAAAIAVIVPTAMFATNGNDSSPQPATALPTVTDTNTPSPTSSSTPVMGSDPHALDVTGLPTGAPPAVRLVTGGALGSPRPQRPPCAGCPKRVSSSRRVAGPSARTRTRPASR